MFVYLLYSISDKHIKEPRGIFSSHKIAVETKELCRKIYPDLHWKTQKFELDNNRDVKL